ncbi:hypothetical protein C2G38_2187054 [Gigaspora rosea]|uniref:Ion transport domain-containing protein n=1 Tax=Gigaspora rosea TaxID=44941 RepID=A0A397V7D2_9GLOM|nr:hypothetical protein C2G38_2187054 [Gigaspora rosea]
MPTIDVIEEEKELYLAISPKGDFVVEFVLLENETEFELRMFKVIKKSNNNDLSDQNYDNRHSSKKLIHIGDFRKPLSFTEDQNILSWSIAVSDKLLSHNSSVRLLAISCISIHDMTLDKFIEGTKKPGITIVFTINGDYSIEKKELIRSDDYGGIVKLFSLNEDNKKTNIEDMDKCFLIILNASGIYKHYFRHLNHKFISKIQKFLNHKPISKFQNFNYSKKIESAMNYNRSRPSFNMKYITRCLNKHYFLVDTKFEDAQYMELYDLKTNQLVNTFHRQNLYESSFIVDIPDFFAISNNNKIFAYRSGNEIKLYLIECGLELASIKLDTGEPSPIDYFMLYFMHFFNDDEKLLICRLSKEKSCQWSIWNIFESIQKSIRFENNLDFNFFQMNNIFNEFIEPSFYQSERTNSLGNLFQMYNSFIESGFYQFERIDSLLIFYKNKEKHGNLSEDKRIYDIFNLEKEDKVEKRFIGIDIWVKERNLMIFKDKKSLLDEAYHICDPWVRSNHVSPQPNDGSPQFFAYLDKEKKIILLIGNYTVQVSYEREKKKRTLEFISVINEDDRDINEHVRERCIERICEKFKLSTDPKDSQSIEMWGDNYVTDAINEACRTLKYLYQMLEEHDKYDALLNHEHSYFKYKEITKQTRNIIIRFIQLYPIVWRLLDIRFDLLSILIDARECSLIKYILFNEKKAIDDDDEPVQNSLLHKRSLHMPQYKSWEGGDNVIFKALSDKNPIFLGYFLEYYSNKAAEEIGWMITVSEILPDLYNKNNENYGFYKSYAQLLFYKRWFCSKGLDMPFFKFIKIPSCITGNNFLEVFIPVTQLIPKDCKLDINKINRDKIPDIQMVPLIDFTANKKILSKKRGDKYLNNLKSIFCPSKFVPQKECPIPFRLIHEVGNNRKDSFYYNPSIEAIMNFIFVFLGYAQYIGLSQTPTSYEVSNGSEVIYNMTGIEPGNSFSNPFRAIIAAYYWSSNSFDAWGFWPLIIISVIFNIIFIIILQNVIVSFMSAAFKDANRDGKRAVLNFQSRLIYDYALRENSAFTSRKNDFDCKFNDKLRIKYVCFYNELSITKAWRNESKEWESEPIYLDAENQIQKKSENEFSIEDEDIKFIWVKEKDETTKQTEETEETTEQAL